MGLPLMLQGSRTPYHVGNLQKTPRVSGQEPKEQLPETAGRELQHTGAKPLPLPLLMALVTQECTGAVPVQHFP